MCRSATHPRLGARVQPHGRAPAATLVCSLGLAALAAAQTPSPTPDWRRIGNSAVELALASPASGPADRVWYADDGERLFVRTASGQVFVTSDFETWQPGTVVPPKPEPGDPAPSLPETGARVRVSPADALRLYAYGGQVFRSDDGGNSWENVTAFERRSVIGGQMRDLAVSPRDGEEVVVANDSGVWRSLDGGISWAGLNDSLPNLPVRRIAALPRGPGGLRLLAGDLGVIEWAPGEKQSWKTVPDASVAQNAASRKTLSETLKAGITVLAAAGDFLYAGSADGRLWASLDKGRGWSSTGPAERGPVEAIFVDPQEPRLALAALAGSNGPRVLRTIDGGQSWDDLTSDLPEAAAHGIAADTATATVYVATDRGLYMTRADLRAAGPATPWTQVQGLPSARVFDVNLDAEGNQLFAAVEGYGVYAAMAPHRIGRLRLVNAADLTLRAAAPGSLVSVLGGRVLTARAGGLNYPVLAASDTETQIQVPFGARGGPLSLALETGQGSYRLAMPLEAVSPAVFVHSDGTPLVLDADSGVLLDAMNTAHSNSRLQILATGLGRVRPDWPSGVPGPVQNSPQVVAPVRVYLDRAPVAVTRAVLAPGYVGLYLVEVQLPAIVNSGPAELYVESEGHESNRVRVWIEP
jgi:uncharacterized protein (TIGR03437 family)